MEMKLASSVVHNWGELDLPLRISAAMGLLSGASLPIVYEFILPSFGGAPSIIGLALTIIYPPLALFVTPSIAGIVGTIALLLRPMSVEQRGIVGFIVFIASVPGVFFMLLYAVYLWGPHT